MLKEASCPLSLEGLIKLLFGGFRFSDGKVVFNRMVTRFCQTIPADVTKYLIRVTISMTVLLAIKFAMINLHPVGRSPDRIRQTIRSVYFTDPKD